MVQQKALIESILRADALRWKLLRYAAVLGLPDCWIAAGFVRNAVWDYLHQRPPAPPSGDVDVIWFDPALTDPVHDRAAERTLQALEPGTRWSVKNQARMHLRNGDCPYRSASDAMCYWPETATAIAVRLTAKQRLEIAAPLGLQDLLTLTLRPGPHFAGAKRPQFDERVRAKEWLHHWPRLALSHH